MKKVLSVLLLIGAMFAIQAAAPTYDAVDAVYEWYIDTTITVSDTIADSDSATIIDSYDVETGWQYIITRNDFTGETSDDSIDLVLRVFAEDDTGATLYYVDVDSATTIAGEAYDLDIGGSLYPRKITIKYKALTDKGDELIVPQHRLIRRRPWQLQRNR